MTTHALQRLAAAETTTTGEPAYAVCTCGWRSATGSIAEVGALYDAHVLEHGAALPRVPWARSA